MLTVQNVEDSYALPASTTVTLPITGGSLVKRTTYSFANISQPPPWSSVHVEVGPQLNTAREYAYGSSAVGPLLRTTNYTYLSDSNPTYRNKNILDRVASKVVSDGNGINVEQTQYEYDIYTAGIQASGAIQHDASFNTSYLVRGNLTAVKRWRNTDGSWLTTRNQYDDVGSVLPLPIRSITRRSLITPIPGPGKAAAIRAHQRADKGKPMSPKSQTPWVRLQSIPTTLVLA